MTKQTTIDPIAILSEMAANPETPATARVMACKQLIALRRASEKGNAGEAEAPSDAVTARALRLLKGGKS